MSMVKVEGILRALSIDRVEKTLWELQVPGVTVSRVKGYGEYANFFARDLMDEHARFEVFVPEERGEEVARAIMEAGRSGSSGDGLVAILPVSALFKVRTETEATPDDL